MGLCEFCKVDEDGSTHASDSPLCEICRTPRHGVVPPLDVPYCDFCRPRVYDLSQLGWKQQRDDSGHISLRPRHEGSLKFLRQRLERSTTRPYQSPSFRELLERFPKVDSAPDSEISDRAITIEYQRLDSLPGLPRLSASSSRGCRFCTLLWQVFNGDHQYSRELLSKYQDRLLMFLDLTYSYRRQSEVFGYSGRRVGTSDYDLGLWELHIRCAPDEQKTVHVKQFELDISFLNKDQSFNYLNIVQSPVSRDLFSKRTVETFKTWIRDCTEGRGNGHRHCRPPEQARIPDRVLDIGTTASPTLRIRELHGHRGKYAALSYCWGSPSLSKPSFTTLRSNLAAFKARLPWSELPVLFRDTILLLRQLHCRYLWIDALCIVQDDLKDWERQAAQMSDIYHHSWFTIAPYAVTSPYEEARSREPASAWIDLPWIYSGDSSLRGSYLVNVDRTKEYETLGTGMEESRWSARAWTFQEKLLSPRILYLGRNGAHWECHSGEALETYPWSLTPGYRPRLPSQTTEFGSAVRDFRNLLMTGRVTFTGRSIHNISTDYLFKIWYQLIATYSQRNMTFAADTVVALAGLAEAMRALLRTADPTIDLTIFGGLWKADILRGLLWFTPSIRGSSVTAGEFAMGAGSDDEREEYGPKADLEAEDQEYTEVEDLKDDSPLIYSIPKEADLADELSAASWMPAHIPLPQRSRGRLYDFAAAHRDIPSARSLECPYSGFVVNQISMDPHDGDSRAWTTPTGSLHITGRVLPVDVKISDNDDVASSRASRPLEDESTKCVTFKIPSTPKTAIHIDWTKQTRDTIMRDNSKVFAVLITAALLYETQVRKEAGDYIDEGHTWAEYGLLMVPTDQFSDNHTRRLGCFYYNLSDTKMPKAVGDGPSPFRLTEPRSIVIV